MQRKARRCARAGGRSVLHAAHGESPMRADNPGAGAPAVNAPRKPVVSTSDELGAIIATQYRLTRLIASERAPTNMRLKAHVASRLNQLRDTNLRPR